MYSRDATASDGTTTEPLSFGVSGKLWHGVLVMYDRESGSLWTQIEGRAIAGDRVGQTLEHVPSAHTTWSRWKAAHPGTLVLEKTGDEAARTESRYADYLADQDRLFLPELAEGLGGVAAKDVVFGVAVDGAALAVTESVLREQRVVNAVVGLRPVLWVLDEPTGAVSAFDRSTRDGALIVRRSSGGALVDPRGDPVELESLDALRVDRAFWYAWKRSHPDSRVLSD